MYVERRRELGFFSLGKVKEGSNCCLSLHKRAHGAAEPGLSQRCTATAREATGTTCRKVKPLVPGATGPREEQWVFQLCCFSLTEGVKGSRGQAHVKVGIRKSTFPAQLQHTD